MFFALLGRDSSKIWRDGAILRSDSSSAHQKILEKYSLVPGSGVLSYFVGLWYQRLILSRNNYIGGNLIRFPNIIGKSLPILQSKIQSHIHMSKRHSIGFILRESKIPSVICTVTAINSTCFLTTAKCLYTVEYGTIYFEKYAVYFASSGGIELRRILIDKTRFRRHEDGVRPRNNWELGFITVSHSISNTVEGKLICTHKKL